LVIASRLIKQGCFAGICLTKGSKSTKPILDSHNPNENRANLSDKNEGVAKY
jgi:hypothetical protein